MKRYELQRIGEGGLIYLEESDILCVRPRKGDALLPVEVELHNRPAYRIEDGFRYDGRTRTVVIGLSLRQANELIEQDRTAQGKGFCEGCYDFGQSTDPEECARCRVLHALHMAGQGDMRKVRIPLPQPRSHGLVVAFVCLFLAFWFVLCQWTTAANERDAARRELGEVRRRSK